MCLPFLFCFFGRDSVPTYHLAALGAARVALVSLHPVSSLLLIDPIILIGLSIDLPILVGLSAILVGLSIDPATLVGLSSDLPFLVGLSMQMLAPTGLLVPARLLIGLLAPRMLYNFTSSLASSIASILQVVVIMIITFALADVIATLVEVEAEHSSGGLSRRTNFVSRQTGFFLHFQKSTVICQNFSFAKRKRTLDDL